MCNSNTISDRLTMTIKFLSTSTVHDLCKALDIKPTKTLGQNFVVDQSTVKKIVSKIGDISNQHVVEVGPGLGSLTLAILEQNACVSAIEIDPKLAIALPSTIKAHAPNVAHNLRILNQDALKVNSVDDFMEAKPVDEANINTKIFSSSPKFLIANLPYNVSVPIILNILENFPSIHSILVMVQLEVAQRLTATCGNKIYGVPSLKLAWYGSSRMVGKIGANVFWPVPNVDSALVLFERENKYCDFADVGNDFLRKTVFDCVDCAFGQRRKTLRQSLKAFCGDFCSTDDLLAKAGIDPSLRAEALNIDDFVCIAKAFISLNDEGD